MDDPTIEHFALGQFVLYAPAPLPPPPESAAETEVEEAAVAPEEQAQVPQTTVADGGRKEEGFGEDKVPGRKEQGDNENAEISATKDESSGGPDESEIENASEDRNIMTQTFASPGVESQNATVIGVHRDDFPNIYYTIRMEGSDRERQTVASRLTPRETREEAEARIAEIHRKKAEEDRRKNEEALEERARLEREAILKRKLEEKAAAEAHGGDCAFDTTGKSGDKKSKSKNTKKSMSEKCSIS